MVENYIPKLWTVSKICNVISTSVLINMFSTIKSNKTLKRTVENRAHEIGLNQFTPVPAREQGGKKPISRKRKKKIPHRKKT